MSNALRSIRRAMARSEGTYKPEHRKAKEDRKRTAEEKGLSRSGKMFAAQAAFFKKKLKGLVGGQSAVKTDMTARILVNDAAKGKDDA